jgi:8-oxo-dGTP pyrophosphatase MutT (NUDIX family)
MQPGEKVFVIVYRVTNGFLELLALKPNPEPNRNTKDYVVTGGVEHYDESFESAALREVWEEIGIKSNQVVDLDYAIPYTDHITLLDYIEHCYGVRVNNEPIILNHEHISYKWLDVDTFINTIWWDFDKKILEGMISRIQKHVHSSN